MPIMLQPKESPSAPSPTLRLSSAAAGNRHPQLSHRVGQLQRRAPTEDEITDGLDFFQSPAALRMARGGHP